MKYLLLICLLSCGVISFAAQPKKVYSGEAYQIIYVKGTIMYSKTARPLSVGDTIYIDQKDRYKEHLKFGSNEAVAAAFNPQHGRIHLSKSGANYASSAAGWEPSRPAGLEYLSDPTLPLKNIVPDLQRSHLDSNDKIEAKRFLVLGKKYEAPINLLNPFGTDLYPVNESAYFSFQYKYRWANPDGKADSVFTPEIRLETYNGRLVFDHAFWDKITEKKQEILKQNNKRRGAVTPYLVYQNIETNKVQKSYFSPYFPGNPEVKKGVKVMKEMMQQNGKDNDAVIDSVFSYLVAYYGAPEPSNALSWLKENFNLEYSETGAKKRFGFPTQNHRLVVLGKEVHIPIEPGFLADIEPNLYIMLDYGHNHHKYEDTLNLNNRRYITLNPEFFHDKETEKNIEQIKDAVLFYYNANGAPVKITELSIAFPTKAELRKKIAPVIEQMRTNGKSVHEIQTEVLRVLKEFYGTPLESDVQSWLAHEFKLQ